MKKNLLVVLPILLCISIYAHQKTVTCKSSNLEAIQRVNEVFKGKVSTRYARDHKAQYTLEVIDENASIKWSLHDLNRLECFDYPQQSIIRGWRSILANDADQLCVDKWWVLGLIIGYEHTIIHPIVDFLKSLETGKDCSPTLQDALETQKVCQAVLDSEKKNPGKI